MICNIRVSPLICDIRVSPLTCKLIGISQNHT